MPKPKVTPQVRATQFKCDGFYVTDNILMCKFCNCRLEHERMDTLKKHLESDRHKKQKLGSVCKRQVSLQEAQEISKKAKTEKEYFVKNTTEAFIAAGIPLEKLDHPSLRNWIAGNVTGGGDLPCADTLRRKYVPLIGQKMMEGIKEKISNEDLVILCDETTDKNGNCVFNILFKTLKPSSAQDVYLASSVVLDTANSTTCTQAILEILNKYDVKFENCIAIVTDSAPYMNKCATTLLGVIGEHLIHIQCWAHKINLVGNIWQHTLKELNNFVINVKSAFLNTRKRRHAYLTFLSERYKEDPQAVKLFPLPVPTRWNSWFKAVVYIDKYFDDIIAFMNEMIDCNNSGVKDINDMTQHELQEVRVQACFVAENCTKLIKLIELLEGNSFPTSHLLQCKLEDICTKLELLKDGIFSHAIKQKLSVLRTVKQAEVVNKLKTAAQQSETKLKTLMSSDPARSIFHSCSGMLHPRHHLGQSNEKDITTLLHKLPTFKECRLEPSCVIEGLRVLKRITAEQLQDPNIENVDLCEILCSLRADYPQFSTFALKLLWLPASNADTERSFSTYSCIVSDRRRRLTPENAEIYTMVSYNKD